MSHSHQQRREAGRRVGVRAGLQKTGEATCAASHTWPWLSFWLTEAARNKRPLQPTPGKRQRQSGGARGSLEVMIHIEAIQTKTTKDNQLEAQQGTQYDIPTLVERRRARMHQ